MISSLKAGDLAIPKSEYPSSDNSPFLISGDEASEVGTYTVKVTAKDNSNYSGYVAAEYTIAQKNINSEDIDISLSEDAFLYDGSAKTPDVTVTHDNVTLEEGVDYTKGTIHNMTKTHYVLGTDDEFVKWQEEAKDFKL